MYFVSFKVIPLRCNTRMPILFPMLKTLLICAFWYGLEVSMAPSLSPQLSQNSGFSVLGTGKWHSGPSLVNVLAEAWLRSCFCPKNYERVMTHQLTHYRAACFMSKRLEKIVWYKRTDMPTSSATSRIVIQRSFLTIFFTATQAAVAGIGISFFSAFYEKCLPLINTFFFHKVNWPNTTENILSELEPFVFVFHTKFNTHSLIHFFDSKISPSILKHIWPVYLSKAIRQCQQHKCQ